jgi:hypothetical protein
VSRPRFCQILSEARLPRLPDLGKYDGEDPRPKTLLNWSKEVALWLRGSGLDPDSIRSFYYIAGFMDGHAKSYLHDYLAPELDKHHATHPNAAMTDRLPIPVSMITSKLRYRFVSKTVLREAEGKFNSLTQHRGGRYIPVQELADELEDLGTELL